MRHRDLRGEMIYWPEAFGQKIDFVGYNHAVSMLCKAAGDLASNELGILSDFRLYCNIPWHHNPEELKIDFWDWELPVVAYTMLESTRLPGAWVKFLNKHITAILTPTQWCADMFRISGVKIPIKVVSLGVDPDEHKYIPIKPHDQYTFLWMGHTYDPNGRKGAAKVEQAFRELQSEGRIPDSRLILKYRPHQEDLPKDMIEVEPGIFHVSGTLPIEQLHDLYSEVDCCVNPSRGEGFGFIPLEQMAMGRPVILTNWSYPYIDTRYCIPVKYDLEPSPVVWCYKHIGFGWWGIEWNFGRGIKYKKMPKLLPTIPNGSIAVGPGGVRTQIDKSIWKSIKNILPAIQKKLKLYRRFDDNSRHEIRLESTGLDASVDIKDLKKKMYECYIGRRHYEEMGRRASEYALNHWGLDRMKSELHTAIDELYEKGVL